MDEKYLSVKEFEDRIEQCFEVFKVEDYQNYIRNEAEQVSPDYREDFINALEETVKKERPQQQKSRGIEIPAIDLNEYTQNWTDRIEAFQESYDDLVGRYENNEYDEDEYEMMIDRHNSYDYFDYDEGLDFDEMNGYQELLEEGYEILSAARKLFNSGHYEHAKIIFALMADVINNMDYNLFPLNSGSEKMQFIEDFSRLIRCIYLTESMPNRPEAMYRYMREGVFSCEEVNIHSMIVCAKEPLEGINEFLPLWQEYLLKEPVTIKTSHFIREAAKISGGLEEIKKLAFAHGEKYPEAYIDWIYIEKSENRDITDTCLYAIEQVKKSGVGVSICEHLAEQAEKNKDTKNCLIAWKKAFGHEKELKHLILMLKYSKIEGCYRESLAYALDETKHSTAKADKGDMAFHIGLLSGEIEEVFNSCKDSGGLGWSFQNSRVPVFAGFLMKCFSKGKESTKEIDVFWHYYTSNLDESREYNKLISDSIKSLELSAAEKEKYYRWCENICGKRVDEIVSNKHRGAYDRAAMALAACAEAKSALYGAQEGAALIEKYLQKYPKHNKFKAAVRDAR